MSNCIVLYCYFFSLVCVSVGDLLTNLVGMHELRKWLPWRQCMSHKWHILSHYVQS